MICDSAESVNSSFMADDVSLAHSAQSLLCRTLSAPAHMASNLFYLIKRSIIREEYNFI